MGESIYAHGPDSMCVCVFVFLVSSTMFILEHIWAFGGDMESGFVCLVVISFPCIPRREKGKERERRYWGHLSFFFNLMISTICSSSPVSFPCSWSFFFVQGRKRFCNINDKREVQREILWAKEERRESIHGSSNCKFCARFVLIGETALQDWQSLLIVHSYRATALVGKIFKDVWVYETSGKW